MTYNEYLAGATALAVSLLCLAPSAITLMLNCFSYNTNKLLHDIISIPQWWMIVLGRRGWLASGWPPVEVGC